MGDEVAGKRALNGVLNEVLNGGWWRQKKCCPKVPISLLYVVAKMGKNGVGVTVGVTNGVTFFASNDTFNGKNRGKKREKWAETYPLMPFNA